jgi:hypothetical protein
MNKLIHNWLTVLGSKRQLTLFLASKWKQQLRLEYDDWVENSPGRYVCQFEKKECALRALKRLSRRWPRLIFLLAWENEQSRTTGLGKAKSGHLEHCEISY